MIERPAATRSNEAMTDFSPTRVRVFSTWERVLYVDHASGQLRHGPIGESPANAFFVLEPSSPGSYRREWFAQVVGHSVLPIECLPDHCRSLAKAASNVPAGGPTALQVIPLERGLVGFELDGVFLCAQPEDGSPSRTGSAVCGSFSCCQRIGPARFADPCKQRISRTSIKNSCDPTL